MLKPKNNLPTKNTYNGILKNIKSKRVDNNNCFNVSGGIKKYRLSLKQSENDTIILG